MKMHADEVEIDEALVRRLIAAQFPEWAGLTLERVPSAGTDNALFRLGSELAVRLPRMPDAVGQVERDRQWLPKLAPHLPLPVPVPVAVGEPGDGLDWSWGVYRWLEGEEARFERFADPTAAARDVGGFIRALQGIDAVDGRTPTPGGYGRGVPLAVRDAYTREGIAAVADEFDPAAVTAAWEASLAAEPYAGPPVWLHADLAPGNLLVADGRLAAVIDFATLVVGDPAVDLLPAWNLFTGPSRDAFRDATAADDATWLRGRGWALSIALIALPYYRGGTNPTLSASSRHVISEVLKDDLR